MGLGVILGEPTGVTGKLWHKPDMAYDVGLSYSWRKYFILYGDHLWHWKNIFEGRSDFMRSLWAYAGVGAGVYFGGGGGLGVRIPLGFEWKPKSPPLGIFAEIVPTVGLIPTVSGGVGGGIGARYYFE